MNRTRWSILLGASIMLCAVAGGGNHNSPWAWLGTAPVMAQTRPTCEPPAPDEHLVLVNQQTEAELNQLQSLLPSGSTTTICQYLGDTVIRVGGFANEEVATAWGEYLANTLDTQTAIVRPASPFSSPDDDDSNSPSSPPTPPAASDAPAYAPQLLGPGYAVLVDYADRPDVAIALQSTLDESVGLAVYRQIPYLLALYSDNGDSVTDLLTSLASSDFNAILVDSREVILMTPELAVSP